MKKLKVLWTALAVMVCCMAMSGAAMAANYVRNPEVTAARSGCTFVYVDGILDANQTDTNYCLNKVNELRKAAYEAGTISENVTMNWSHELTEIAQTRAAEQVLRHGTKRPNGTDYTTMTYGAVKPDGEIVAYKCDTNMQLAFDAILKDTTYYNMLTNPSYKYMSVGMFVHNGEGYMAIELEDGSDVHTSGSSISDSVDQKLEVLTSAVSALSFTGKSTIRVGTVAEYKMNNITVTFDTTKTTLNNSAYVTWSADDTSLAAAANVQGVGKITALNWGYTVIRAKLDNMSAKMKLDIKPRVDNKVSGFRISVKKKKLKIRWNKNASLFANHSSLVGYHLEIATDAKFKNIVKVKDFGPNRKKCNFKGKKKTKYYVRIAYRFSDGTLGYYTTKAKKTRR